MADALAQAILFCGGLIYAAVDDLRTRTVSDIVCIVIALAGLITISPPPFRGHCWQCFRSYLCAGFGVMGGIFGEGVDLAGSRLIGCAIVGVGLPQVNPQQEMLRRYYDAQNGSGFDYAYRYPGMNKVLQAAGA